MNKQIRAAYLLMESRRSEDVDGYGFGSSFVFNLYWHSSMCFGLINTYGANLSWRIRNLFMSTGLVYRDGYGLGWA